MHCFENGINLAANRMRGCLLYELNNTYVVSDLLRRRRFCGQKFSEAIDWNLLVVTIKFASVLIRE